MEEGMETTRLEAFSDGVIAVIITIMVLELKVPSPPTIEGLVAEWPVFLAYAVSFTIVAIYWVNHHHMFAVARRVSAPTMWRNIIWLFWLSLYPFITHFLSVSGGSPTALALYGALGAITTLAWGLMSRDLGKRNRDVSALTALRPSRQIMNIASVVINLAAIPLAFLSRPAAIVLLLLPPMAYFMPARSLERHVT